MKMKNTTAPIYLLSKSTKREEEEEEEEMDNRRSRVVHRFEKKIINQRDSEEMIEASNTYIFAITRSCSRGRKVCPVAVKRENRPLDKCQSGGQSEYYRHQQYNGTGSFPGWELRRAASESETSDSRCEESGEPRPSRVPVAAALFLAPETCIIYHREHGRASIARFLPGLYYFVPPRKHRRLVIGPPR